MKVLALSPYPVEGASARYRVYAFQAGLARHGIQLEVHPFLTSAIFHERGLHGNKKPSVLAGIVDGFLRRWLEARYAKGRYDAIYIHRQAFPLFQKQLDQLFIRTGVPLIFDMDDAVFTEYPIDHLLERCAAVTVGNDYLADYVRRVAPQVPVTVVPTTVNLEQYGLRRPLVNAAPVVGWIGTASTFNRYLLPVLPQLVAVTQQNGGEFRVIASPNVREQVEAVGGVFVPWSLEDEIAQLQQFDIGVMPLHDDEYVRGKCAFKLIQYGAVGMASVGTDIGANREVVADGQSGYLTTSTEEMQARLHELLQSPALRMRFGTEARRIVEQRFSLQSQIAVMAELFQAAKGR